ncbi:TetR/AcrR family transcriptional regulator [Phytomonospora sp. NPDC050363]|uniref:TetR/AcrR family transcriptional regulator n=1 Tax=Phytomonospora sp. NPDC050363 TaxID=3155642 RepID=UPI0033FA3EB3
MAVPFTPAERERIRALLLQTGERLFAAQGLKKTSLDELVAPAEVAKGSFYAFFDSKEALYAAVMVGRAPLIAERLAPALKAPPTVDGLCDVMRALTEVLTTDPFYRRLLTHPDELRAVARRVGAGELAQVRPHLVQPLLDYVTAGQKQSLIAADVGAETVIGVMRTAGLVVMNRELFGEEYPQVLDATIRTLARGLSTEGSPR